MKIETLFCAMDVIYFQNLKNIIRVILHQRPVKVSSTIAAIFHTCTKISHSYNLSSSFSLRFREIKKKILSSNFLETIIGWWLHMAIKLAFS